MIQERNSRPERRAASKAATEAIPEMIRSQDEMMRQQQATTSRKKRSQETSTGLNSFNNNTFCRVNQKKSKNLLLSRNRSCGERYPYWLIEKKIGKPKKNLVFSIDVWQNAPKSMHTQDRKKEVSKLTKKRKGGACYYSSMGSYLIFFVFSSSFYFCSVLPFFFSIE